MRPYGFEIGVIRTSIPANRFDAKYSLLVKSYPRGLWMSKMKSCEKARKAKKNLKY